jgi:hypothetical protein
MIDDFPTLSVVFAAAQHFAEFREASATPKILAQNWFESEER